MIKVLKELFAEAAPKGAAIRCGPVHGGLSEPMAERTAEVSAEYVFVIYGWPVASVENEGFTCWAHGLGWTPRPGSDSHA